METGSFMYTLPHCRFTAYAIGMFLGHFFRKHKNFKLTTVQYYFGWSLTFSFVFLTIRLASEMGLADYKYNSHHAALYSVFVPLSVCLFFAWIVWTSEMNYLGNIAKLLKWKGFIITTKLSYNFYLIQFLVFYYNTGSARGAQFYAILQTAVRQIA